MGPIIGNDLVSGTQSILMGTITVNNGTSIFAKSLSQGAVIGGSKNAIDATLVRRYAYKQIALDSAHLAAADVDGNGKVNAIDATLILRYAYKQISVFPVESQFTLPRKAAFAS